MNLTLLLKNDKEVKDQFGKYIKIPKVVEKYPIEEDMECGNPELISRAFYYLMCFYLERKHSKEKVHKSQWAAFNSYHFIVKSYLKTMNTEYENETKIKKKRKILNFVNLELVYAQYEYDLYQKTGRITELLRDRCIFLSKLDKINSISDFKEITNKEISNIEINDLIELAYGLNSAPFEAANQLCLFNDYEIANQISKGAGSNFIIDDTLTEVKVKSKIELDKETIYSLVANSMLIKNVKNITIKNPLKINNLAIYFASHKVLLTYTMEEIIAPDDYKILTAWFKNHLEQTN